MSCPNCGAYMNCHCTYAEKIRAKEIIRQRQREFRRRIGTPTVVEQELESHRKFLTGKERE